MDFRYTEDQTELAEGARAFLMGEATPERLRKLDSETTTDGLWGQIAEMGLLGVMTPEDQGGLGLGAADFALIAEAAGEVALPDPLIENAGVAAPLIAQIDEKFSRAIAAGEHSVAISHTLAPFANSRFSPDAVLIIDENKVSLAKPNSDDGIARGARSVDPFRTQADFDDGEGIADGNRAQEIYNAAAQLGAVFGAAELIGLGVGALNQATAYAKQREQFGKPIGPFQAVKHLLATAFIKLEYARPLVARAAQAIDDRHEDADLFISQAKLSAGDAATFAAEAAIQTHGAMGYTYEVDLHYWMKKIWARAGQWGDDAYHRNRIEACLFDGNRSVAPPDLSF
ncbi:MAG: acyl-CoA dehydrogenase family protein [Pseudomonadota bacterium]